MQKLFFCIRGGIATGREEQTDILNDIIYVEVYNRKVVVMQGRGYRVLCENVGFGKMLGKVFLYRIGLIWYTSGMS